MDTENKKDIISDLNLLLTYIPEFGEFPNVAIHSTTKEGGENITRNIFSPDYLYEMFVYLINKGFAINRTDLRTKNTFFIQLTDRGRELKYHGSIDAFNKKFKADYEKEIHRNRMEIFALGINFSIAIGVFVAAVYYISEMYKEKVVRSIFLVCFVFLCGLISGMLIYMLISEGLSRRRNK